MALVVMAARAILHGRISHAALPLLWIPVAIRFLMPLELPALKLGFDVSAASVRSGGSWHSVWMPQPPTASLSALSAGHSTTIAIVAVLWTAGSLVTIARFAILYRIQTRSIGIGMEPASPTAATWLESHPLKRQLILRESPVIRTPVARGFLRPAIFVPSGFFDQPDYAVTAALEHEFAHIRRFDPAFRELLLLVSCMFWFNPLLWIAHHMLIEDQELACDASAIARLGEASRAFYATALIDAADAAKQPGSFAAAFKRGHRSLETRIVAIIRPVNHPVRTAIASACTLLLALGMATAASILPEARVELGCYSFTIPSYWNGKVDVRATEDSADVCLLGNPDLVLVSLTRADSPDYWKNIKDNSSQILWSGTDIDGRHYQMRGLCYTKMVMGDAWRTTPFSTPAYPGVGIANLAVELSTGGAISAGEAASWTGTEDHDLDGFLREIAASVRAA